MPEICPLGDSLLRIESSRGRFSFTLDLKKVLRNVQAHFHSILAKKDEMLLFLHQRRIVKITEQKTSN